MKFVLCSEGFSTPNTVEACTKLVGKPKGEISIGIINEAFAVEHGDKRWVLHNLQCVFDNFSGEVDIVNLLALSIEEVEARLVNKDVIFVVGGDTDYLMGVYEKTGFDKLLPKLLETKVYVGSSAGSMVVGRRISAAAYRLIYGEDSKWGIDAYLGLADLSVMPHLDSPDFPNRKDTLLEAVGEFEVKVYGLRDGSAVVIDGNSVTTIGSEPLIIEKGKVI
ncbi:MAG TPA: Type 1 glutamine amidotransferase-like domain-containing protein [Candidatus Saccharibacteria bacterium]|nr:Type 1 glutamine amidotransferase-like domain-containing protein [Candidatus Saccharibacteria bacterium]